MVMENGNLAMDIPLGGSSYPLFPGPFGIWNIGFCGGRKTGGSGARNKDEPTTNSTHMLCKL